VINNVANVIPAALSRPFGQVAAVSGAITLVATAITVLIVRNAAAGSSRPAAWANALAAVSVPATPVPARFDTLPPGAVLPSGAQCAVWVRTKPFPENRGANRRANQTTGHPVGSAFFSGDDPRANSKIAPRMDGQFTGVTREILRWAACKWGADENLVLAQAAIESRWQQNTVGDWTGDASRCAPDHGPGVDGMPGQCPESFGVLQARYPNAKAAWPGIANSTAMNADVTYGMWRVCFEGYEGWLNTLGRGRDYAAGDAWGCVGRSFSGQWHVPAGDEYVRRVRGFLDQRIWETRGFQQP
jgi:autotransporter family porin